MTRHLPACLLILGTVVVAGAYGQGPPPPPPNFVIILADDLGYADVGFNGCRDIPTPHLDAIAANGVRCAQAYASHPFCSPSRAGLLTGRYQQRFGHENNPVYDPDDEQSGLPVSQILLPQMIHGEGYISGAIGKWHLGAAERFHPLNRGFDEFFGFLGGGHQYFPERLGGRTEYTTDLIREREPIKETEYLTDAFSREAVAFIDRRHARRFCLYLAFNAPHTPLQAPPRYLERFASIQDEKRRTYAAMVSALDDGVGRVLDALRRHHIEESTLVFFLSDNGGPVGERSNGSDNRPLRDGKGTTYEGGVRVPFAACWKGVIPAGIVYEPMVSALDIAATIRSQARATVDQDFDGVDLVPYWTRERSGPPHPALYWRTGGGTTFGLRVDALKVVIPPDGTPRLFDLAADASERRDVAADHTEVLRGLLRLRDAWNRQMIQPVFPGRSAKPPARPAAPG